MESKRTHEAWEASDSHWADYAESFAHPIRANNLLSRFITNSAVTGAYAETWVKRICKNSLMEDFRKQLKRLQNCVPNRSHILGLVIAHGEPLSSEAVQANWLDDGKWRATPAMTRLFSRSYKAVDVNGVFAFIYFLSQVAGQSDLIVR